MPPTDFCRQDDFETTTWERCCYAIKTQNRGHQQQKVINMCHCGLCRYVVVVRGYLCHSDSKSHTRHCFKNYIICCSFIALVILLPLNIKIDFCKVCNKFTEKKIAKTCRNLRNFSNFQTILLCHSNSKSYTAF